MISSKPPAQSALSVGVTTREQCATHDIAGGAAWFSLIKHHQVGIVAVIAIEQPNPTTSGWGRIGSAESVRSTPGATSISTVPATMRWGPTSISRSSGVSVCPSAKAKDCARFAHAFDAAHHVQHKVIKPSSHQTDKAQIGTMAQPN